MSFGMYSRKYPWIVDNPAEIASIDIREAHILWHPGKNLFNYLPGEKHPGTFVKVFRFKSREDNKFQNDRDYRGYADTGACWVDWKHRPIEDLVTECKEMMIEFMMFGMDPILVAREFGKIRQIVDEGAKSFWMGRCLSMAYQGLVLDCLEQWDLGLEEQNNG